MSNSIADYQVIRLIARGGMAEVHLAERCTAEGFRKRVAIKRMLPGRTSDPVLKAMFLDEARLASRFSHPHIVQVFDLVSDSAGHGVVMEFIDGHTLGDLLVGHRQEDEFMAVELCAKTVSAVCEALHYAHELRDARGEALAVVHRDVCPQNIMLSREGAVKLIDFGVAKARSNTQQTQTQALKGKIAYMSPEQIRQELILDQRTDIFSLGIVLFEILTGQHPFGDTSQPGSRLAMLNAIVYDEPLDPRTLRADLPPTLITIMRTALAKDRDQRYRSAHAMQQALDTFLRSRSVWVDGQTIVDLLAQERWAEEADDQGDATLVQMIRAIEADPRGGSTDDPAPTLIGLSHESMLALKAGAAAGTHASAGTGAEDRTKNYSGRAGDASRATQRELRRPSRGRIYVLPLVTLFALATMAAGWWWWQNDRAVSGTSIEELPVSVSAADAPAGSEVAAPTPADSPSLGRPGAVQADLEPAPRRR